MTMISIQLQERFFNGLLVLPRNSYVIVVTVELSNQLVFTVGKDKKLRTCFDNRKVAVITMCPHAISRRIIECYANVKSGNSSKQQDCTKCDRKMTTTRSVTKVMLIMVGCDNAHWFLHRTLKFTARSINNDVS